MGEKSDSHTEMLEADNNDLMSYYVKSLIDILLTVFCLLRLSYSNLNLPS